MKPIRCYASIIGGCSEKQSYEHYVSQGIFKNKFVTVEGQKWAEEPKTVGKSKIGLPILCTSHNSLLSPIDAYGIKVFRILEDCVMKQNERHKLSRSSMWKKDEYIIKGSEFEKWMIKAAIGVTFEDPKIKWHLKNSELLNPPREIVEALFGIGKLRKPMGLYGIFAPDDSLRIEDRVGLETLLHPQTNCYVGSMINFRHFQFLIYLMDEEILEHNFISPSGVRFGEGFTTPQYHNPQFQFNAKGKISAIVDFDWTV
jgi:hypothetical protein